MTQNYEPQLTRTHRKCSTKGCARNALFFPWVEIFKDKKLKSAIHVEAPLQYCPVCKEKILAPEDLGKDWTIAVQKASEHFGEKYTPNLATLHWHPLIVGPEDTRTPYSPSNHD